MKVLQIAKLTGGIGRHVREITKRSKHDFIILDYDHAINIPLLRAFTFVFLGIPIGLFRILKNKIDIIHSHYLIPAGLLGVILGKLTNRPIVVTVHGSDVIRLQNLNFLKKWIGKNSQVVTTTKYLQNKLLELGIKSTVVPNGLDHDGIARAEPRKLEKPAILYVGSLTPTKVGILPNIINSHHNFYIIGEGILKDELKGTKLGQLPPEQVYSYMKGSDIFISTSEWEGFGLAILEAMACGTPIIARPNSGQAELVEGRGILADSSLEFKAGIAKILNDKKLRNRLVKNSINFSKQFSWEETANEIDRVYELSKSR